MIWLLRLWRRLGSGPAQGPTLPVPADSGVFLVPFDLRVMAVPEDGRSFQVEPDPLVFTVSDDRRLQIDHDPRLFHILHDERTFIVRKRGPRMLGTKTKDANAVKPYTLDWARYLGDDTIVASAWIVPDGITKDSDEFTTTTTKIWLSSGALGKRYQITNRITTAAGITDDRSFELVIGQQ